MTDSTDDQCLGSERPPFDARPEVSSTALDKVSRPRPTGRHVDTSCYRTTIRGAALTGLSSVAPRSGSATRPTRIPDTAIYRNNPTTACFLSCRIHPPQTQSSGSGKAPACRSANVADVAGKLSVPLNNWRRLASSSMRMTCSGWQDSTGL